MSRGWFGPAALREFLVPVDSLEPTEDNPRWGHVDAIAASLLRFGQVRPIIVDGSRIIAGHHVRLAAIQIEWTQIAAVPHEFSDKEEARAYMIADNRTHDLGGYDESLLVDHLEVLEDLGALDGTGYTLADLEDMYARLATTDEAARRPPPQRAETVEVVLLYTRDQYEQLQIWERMISKERGTELGGDTYYEGMGIAAEKVNG